MGEQKEKPIFFSAPNYVPLLWTYTFQDNFYEALFCLGVTSYCCAAEKF